MDMISTGPDREETIVLRHPFGLKPSSPGGSLPKSVDSGPA